MRRTIAPTEITTTSRRDRSARHRAAAVVAVASLALAACGDDDNGSSDNGSSDNGSDEDPPATDPAGTNGADRGDDDAAVADLPDMDPVTITFATPGSDDGMINGTKWWADEITARTGGLVEFEFFYNASLLGAVEVLPGIREGRADAGWLPAPYWPTDLPLFQIASIPFETSDPTAEILAYADLYEHNDAFRQEFHDAGIHVTHFVPMLPTMAGLKEPVTGLESLRGKRVRSVGYIGAALDAIGADPAPVDAVEMYESIQRGVLDGYAGFPFDTVTEFSLQEVAPHTLDLGFGHYAAIAVGIDLDLWESLPEPIQEIIDEVTREHHAGQAIAELEALYEPVCDAFEEAGAVISVLPESEVDAWNEIVGDSLRDRWASDAVSSGLDEKTVEEFYDAYHAAYDEHLPDSPAQDSVTYCIERTG